VLTCRGTKCLRKDDILCEVWNRVTWWRKGIKQMIPARVIITQENILLELIGLLRWYHNFFNSSRIHKIEMQGSFRNLYTSNPMPTCCRRLWLGRRPWRQLQPGRLRSASLRLHLPSADLRPLHQTRTRARRTRHSRRVQKNLERKHSSFPATETNGPEWRVRKTYNTNLTSRSECIMWLV